MIPDRVFVGVISKCVVSAGSETVGVNNNNMVAAGVVSRDPLKRIATHSTTVPLYCGSAGMVRVYTVLPSSLIEPDLMLGNRPTDDPFTLQTMIASDDV